MRFLISQYSLSTESLDLYFAGCNGPHCASCHNPESWSFASGEHLTPFEIYTQTRMKVETGMVKNIMLFGGEPLDQPLEELNELANRLQGLNIPIWLFTRYDLQDIPFSLRIKFSYIKTGRYLEECKVSDNEMYGVKLATSNQKIHKRGVDY